MESGLLAIILVFTLLFLAALISLLLKRVQLPFTVAVLLAGLLLGTVTASYGPSAAAALGRTPPAGFLGDLLAGLEGLSHLSPDLILFIFLPTLIFESAFGLDARKLLKDLGPILTLAIPALLISTVIVAAALALGVGESFGVTWPVALLFGALISATDPVAVVALFKELGAPPRLSMLVEGESLFNDGTAIVLFHILLGVVAGTLAAASPLALALNGSLEFIFVFVGGVAVGLVLAFIFAQLIAWVRNDELVEITLTTVLAYASFVVAEHYVHVSGVMATVAAGVTLASYGRTKISPPVVAFMHEFWKYMAYIANALIFFLVGIVIPQRVLMSELNRYLVPLAITLGAVVVARAAGVFTLVPLVGRFTEKISLRFQTIMFWGGLRGAVALALTLAVANDTALPETVRSLFLLLSAGVILTTLLVNALTIRPLLEYFGLHAYDQAELLVRGQGMLSVLGGVKTELARLREEKSFGPAVLERLTTTYQEREERLQAELAAVKTAAAATPDLEEKVLLGQSLAVERRAYLDLYARGVLPEKTTKALQHSVDLLLDRLKMGGALPEDRYHRTATQAALTRLWTVLEATHLLGSWPTNRKADLLADAYDAARGLNRGCQAVLAELAALRLTGAADPLALAEVERRYQNWMFRAQERMNRMAVQYPEYVDKVQALLAGRLCLHLELEGYRHLGEIGVLPDKVVDEMTRTIDREMARLRRFPRSALRFDVGDLLRQVPFFHDLPDHCLAELTRRSHTRTALEEEEIFREGDRGDALFLIARGAVRISVSRPDRILAVLGPGEFFGEMALLSARPRTATATAATPAHLIELSRRAVDEVQALVPELHESLVEAYRERLIDQALARHPAFADLNREQRQKLLGYFQAVELAAGEALPAAGPRLVVVRSGELLRDGQRLGEGDVAGLEVFLGATTTVPLRADSAAALFVFGPEELTRLRQAEPELVAAVARRASQTGS